MPLSEYPDPPWSETDMKKVELLENQRLLRLYTERLASCPHEEDRRSPFGPLRSRGCAYYASAIKILRWRSDILEQELKHETPSSR